MTFVDVGTLFARRDVSLSMRTRHRRMLNPVRSAPADQMRTKNTHAWRRLHDGNIIAEVNTQPGIGVWRASAYRIAGQRNEVAYQGRAYSLLSEAHQGADDLVRREFRHECQVGVCGRWLRWPLRGADTT